MKVLYRKLFLKDLKKLRKQPIYEQIVELAFTVLPEANQLRDVPDVKAMRRHPKRYRIRVSNYWREYRPVDWLFPGNPKDMPISSRSIQKVFEKALPRPSTFT